MGWLLTNVVAAFLRPPLLLLLLGALGLLLLRRRPVLGKSLIAFSLGALTVLSMPVVSGKLLASLEEGALLPQKNPPLAGAIVVLGGGRYLHAPEYGGETVTGTTLERLRYAARLHNRTGAPLLVSGGKPDGGRSSEAAWMKLVLEGEFGVPVRWVEDRSDNTFQEADYCKEILEQQGIDTVYLVTHAWHMPRAKMIFERFGFKVVPAGIIYHRPVNLTALAFLPDARALEDSAWYFHEIVGLVWYRLKS